MRFLILTHVTHTKYGSDWFAYGPYVREMNLWLKYVGDVTIIAPITNKLPDAIETTYQHANIEVIGVKELAFTHLKKALVSVFYLPGIFYKALKEMRRADHIHLRCPGNIGLIGCMAQLFFPKKTKTAKYAGNWDTKSRQPFTYKLQRYLLRNTHITKNMTTLVYGNWPNYTKNTKAFFTASYQDADKKEVAPRALNDKVRLIFVGALTKGKKPMLSAKACRELKEKGYPVELHFYGEGPERGRLEAFIQQHGLANEIFLHGNQSAHYLKLALQESHFLVFISQSEGWPKAVAEAMWWGCLPVTTPVSCVAHMLGNGQRGELVFDSVDAVCKAILFHLSHPEIYREKCLAAMTWARIYTLEFFESEIKKLVRA
jgi:glycosyltransferase involved in cell wall biosynthesis